MKTFMISLLLFICSFSIYSQNITNTIGAGGLFKVTDATTDFFTISQSNGTMTLPLQLAGNQRGSIFKGTDRFLHTYKGTGTDGYNTFLGINAGNFTMGGALPFKGSYNTGVGSQSLYSNTEGVANSAFGHQSLFSNTTGRYNSAFGVYSLLSNTMGFSNSAFGYSSLACNTTGYNNSAFGDSSLFSNTTGFSNSAFGYQSLFSNQTGDSNSAFGYQSLYLNTIGLYNSAFGSSSLYSNTMGNLNSAFGYFSLAGNTTGYNNSAFGSYSLYSNTMGVANSAFGSFSLFSNTTGFQNTAIGSDAGSNITTGYNLTCLGNGAQPTSATATNQITLGNSSVTSLRCNVTTITSLSDARDKKNIKDLDLGINFIMKLKPRIYNWDKREWYEGNISDGSKMKEEPTAGFIAQELDEAQTTAEAEWLNLVLKDNPEKLEATPGNLLPIIVKAMQDLKAENEILERNNEKLSLEVASLKSMNEKLAVLERIVYELTTDNQKVLISTNNTEE